MSMTLRRILPAAVDLVRRDPRYMVAGFLTFILLVGQIRLGFLEGLGQFFTALVVSVATELLLSRVYRREWPNPISAYMTGVSIGILVRSPVRWPYAVGSALAIAQKYAIQLRGRHLFNPSNFGLCILLLGASESVAALSKQWTNMLGVAVFVLALGGLVVARLRRLDVVVTYLACYAGLTLARGALFGASVASELGEILGPPFQLFLFFMITDPKTTPGTRPGRIAYAAAVALLEAALRTARIVHAPFYSLLVISPLFVVLEVMRAGAPSPRPGLAPTEPGKM
jgi:Na+-translocating ferredoxin:NAD+ oxidoreductase RnfD subunit